MLLVPCITLACTCVSYVTVFIDYERRSIPAYNKYIKNISVRFSRNAILIAHIAAGLTEVLRWHCRALTDPTPMPDNFDLFLCFVQSATNLMLVKNLVRGVPTMTRPSYQAGAIMRFITSLVAWQTADAVLHKASVKAANSFIYARTLMFCLKLTMNSKDMTNSSMYNIGVFVSAILAIAEGSPFPYAPHVYVLLVFLVAGLNNWTSKQAEKMSKLSQPMQFLVSTLATLGYVELSTLRQHHKSTEPFARSVDMWASNAVSQITQHTPGVNTLDPVEESPESSMLRYFLRESKPATVETFGKQEPDAVLVKGSIVSVVEIPPELVNT